MYKCKKRAKIITNDKNSSGTWCSYYCSKSILQYAIQQKAFLPKHVHLVSVKMVFTMQYWYRFHLKDLVKVISFLYNVSNLFIWMQDIKTKNVNENNKIETRNWCLSPHHYFTFVCTYHFHREKNCEKTSCLPWSQYSLFQTKNRTSVERVMKTVCALF